jgi:hypothetical protein
MNDMRPEIYFTISLTENEHGFVENAIRDYCRDNDLSFLYYRKFKTGHVPMQREGKIRAKNAKGIYNFIDFCKAEGIILENYFKNKK